MHDDSSVEIWSSVLRFSVYTKTHTLKIFLVWLQSKAISLSYESADPIKIYWSYKI